MIKKFFSFLLVFSFLVSGISAQTAFDYPKPRMSTQVDDYHGIKVNDPYRWMEETKLPEVQRWIEAENALTNSYLATIPQREAIKARLTELWNYERYSSPSKIFPIDGRPATMIRSLRCSPEVISSRSRKPVASPVSACVSRFA